MTRPEDTAPLIPPHFLAFVSRFSAQSGGVDGPSGSQWADGLPRLLATLLDDWGLQPAGPGRTGWTAVVLPVRRDGQPAALKVCWPHVEARDEALALRHWNGQGAVRLLMADPARSALLLEELDPTRDLRSVDIDTACEVVGGLLRQLRVPAPPGMRRLSELAQEQVARLETAEGALPRRMVVRAAGLVRELTSDPACDATLLHSDLHYENVLAGGRAPWLAIDPHPLAGHPAFELQPLLRNRVDELGSGSSFRYLVRRRLEVAGDAAALDEEEVRAWTYVHTAIEAGWAAADGDEEAVTLSIALLKVLDG
jgi:streptomycin 6-kinase